MPSQRQIQELRLQPKLSPQQIQLMKLLQVTSMELEQRIKEEIEANPMLECDELSDELPEETPEETPDADGEEPFGDDEDDDIRTDDPEQSFDADVYNEFLGDDDDDNYKYKINNSSPDDERYDPFEHNASEQSFQDYLLQQLGYRPVTEKKTEIAKCIIGNIDDRGYLSGTIQSIVDTLAFTMGISSTEKEVEDVLKIIQEFDPAGVAARDLKECLLIQISHLQEENPEIDYTNTRVIISDHYDEFIKKHYDKIAKSLGLNNEEIKQAIDQIVKLNPSPGNAFGGSSKSNHIIPDFYIYNINGKLELSLNDRNMPELRVSSYYKKMLEGYKTKPKDRSSREAVDFLQKKIESANWFIDAINQRQATLFKTMKAIMDYQKEFFLTGDETRLRPMILKDVSDIVNLDISTISRVANSKFVQTDFGTFLLKTFFSEGMMNEDGEEVSTREIKMILKNCIEGEDKQKPFTDDALKDLLKEKGYNIARRTVQKYREQLNIPVARLRKQI